MPRDFFPSASADVLRLRAKLLWQVRAFFDERGFLEVETPLLSAETVLDRHLDPIEVTLPDDARRPNAGQRMFLQTSPEFHMKRLLATGEYDAIYQITRAFRAGERGRLHNPEFTMVEWYRVGDDYQAGMNLLDDLSQAILSRGPAERVTYAHAFEQAGMADWRELDAPSRDIKFVESIQPYLGVQQPAILYDYPASEAALARVRDSDPPVAERFELFVAGVELANGYHELLDPDEFARRNEQVAAQRATDGKPLLPHEDSRLVAAMRHGLPACSGAALGFDRLVMVAAGVKSLDEVLAFPIERA